MFNSGDVLLRPTVSGTSAYSGPVAGSLHQKRGLTRIRKVFTQLKNELCHLFEIHLRVRVRLFAMVLEFSLCGHDQKVVADM